ncbi:hypothetical protein ACFV4F_03360 [Kitasatospora sp. NPDC059722]|uniref:hypothetical protein n=1 Tax=Kitasatospora sp. NPDC059722 TaxID=3346925 RepID=UPI00369C44B1
MYDDYDDYDLDEYDDESEDWQPGECDHCTGGEPTDGPLGLLYCACQIGQGADPADCLCGPEDE